MKYLIRSENPDNHRFAFYAILYAEDDRRTIVWYLAVASVAQLYRRYLPRRTYQNHFFPFFRCVGWPAKDWRENTSAPGHAFLPVHGYFVPGP